MKLYTDIFVSLIKISKTCIMGENVLNFIVYMCSQAFVAYEISDKIVYGYICKFN
jgi:hypothetical protein